MSAQLNKIKFPLVGILLFLFVFITGCQTTHYYYVKSEDIKYKENCSIYRVDLKDSSSIKVENPEEAGYYCSKSDSSEYISFNHIDTTYLEQYHSAVIKKVFKSVPINKIKGLKIGMDKFNPLKTFLITGAIFTGIVLLFLAVLASDFGVGGGGFNIGPMNKSNNNH